jgi:type I restriction enzyme S subunit
MSNTVPNGWAISLLSDLAFVDRHSLKNTTQPDYRFRYIDIASVKTATIDIPANYISFDDSPSRARKRVHMGDVLMSTVRPNLQGFAYFDKTGDDFIASTGFAVITARASSVGKFLYQSILSDDISQQIMGLVAGSNYPAISSSNVKNLEILTPPLPEQQKIATILSSVDDVIEKTRAQIDKLKDLKTGMMQELLIKGIGSGGVPHTEFKDSPVGRIPASWDVSRVGDVTQKFQNGYAFSASSYVDEGVPIISMAFIGLDGNFNTHYSKTKYWDESQVGLLERYLVKHGDLLIAMTDVTPTMELIGRCCIARINRNHLLNQRVGLIRLDPSRVDKLFFAYYSNHDVWRDYARGMSGLGAQANLGTSQIADGMIPLPPLQEQKQISSILRSVDELIEKKGKRVSKDQSLKKALMQDLLTGKVRVNTDQREPVVA